ncbi:hypothetical protein RND71_031015 [Anisodus tanguticus]|uniref:Helicase ATP-binding domain-containing protein n=1 Tax=Anisodus tanguticus TaxID=243964 RepID=A0AAE1RIR0_9SOLA|nr:hypothetical protein RND71_031015 [Anisodus tanguticus]
MPTGTGKTIALLSLITSYHLSKPSNPIKLLKLTAGWFRAIAVENSNVPTCSFFENYDDADKAGTSTLPASVYTLQELRLYGKEKGWCPYFLARHMVQQENVVVYSYQYLLDPKVAGIISKEMESVL